MKNKAVYIRTSTDEQNPENQLKDCLSMFEGEYYSYKDKQSAYKDNVERENFNNLKKEIKSRKIKDLYVWDLDRLFRNRKKLISFFKFCDMYGCKIHSFRQKFLENLHTLQEPFNEVIFDIFIQILGWMAEDESKRKSDRVKLAIRKKEGKTLSYKGNVWGRSSISTFKKNQITKLSKEGKSIRQISKILNLSVGTVHKYLPIN